MLVLTRKVGQKLIISDNIEITVLETKGDAVKLGIQAPRDVAVYREEIYAEIKKANQQAVAAPEPTSLDSIVSLLDSAAIPKPPDA